jgi:2-C-methyl-D-erythritol 4-phosphate cytidylyltransferase
VSYSVIIPAAGSGSRMGANVPKVLLQIPGHSLGYSILMETVATFHSDPRCSHIIICYPVSSAEYFGTQVGRFERVHLVPGGQTRQESVYEGIQALVARYELASSSVVLVHDAARCCVDRVTIENVLEGVANYGAVTAGIPAVDSLCRVDNSAAVLTYLDRSKTYMVQTPQGFLLKDLYAAHKQAFDEGIEGTDDASLVARIRKIHMVAGNRANLKVTHPYDMKAVEFYCSERERVNEGD